MIHLYFKEKKEPHTYINLPPFPAQRSMGLLLACYRGDVDAVSESLCWAGCNISELHASFSLLIAAETRHMPIVMLLMELFPESFNNASLQAFHDGNSVAVEVQWSCFQRVSTVHLYRHSMMVIVLL